MTKGIYWELGALHPGFLPLYSGDSVEQMDSGTQVFLPHSALCHGQCCTSKCGVCVSEQPVELACTLPFTLLMIFASQFVIKCKTHSHCP